MEEVGLGIGRVRGEMDGIGQEWLGWYDRQGNPYPLPLQSLERKDEQLRQMREKLRSLGIDPDL